MTSLKPRTASSLLLWAAVSFMTVVVEPAAVRAQAGAAEARAQKAGSQAKKARPAVAGKTKKSAGTKAKQPASETAKADDPASEAAVAPAQAAENVPTCPPAATSERVDFDSDADDVQKMEPSLELIQAAPRRARHRSLVPASPSPEDSVVNRQ